MKSRFLLTAATAALLGSAASAQSDWQITTGWMQFKESGPGYDIDLGALYASVGYRLEVAPSFVIIPEATIATGVTEDTLYGVDFEVGHFIAGGARAQYEFTNGLYLFGVGSYGELEVDTEYGSGSSTEFGLGGGIGYNFDEKLGAEFIYSQFDETDVFQLGLKVRF